MSVPDDPLDWTDLPSSVRTTVIAMAADAVGALPPDQVPPLLARVARFAPAKRARSGAGVLAKALDVDAGFRALVAQRVSAAREGDDGRLSTARNGAAEAVRMAARAFLQRLPDAAPLIAAAAEVDETASLRAQVAVLSATVDKLTARLARRVGAVGAADTPPGSDRHSRRADEPTEPEVARLRQRLRDQGTRVKAAEQAAQEAVTQARAAQADAELRVARERANAENWRLRAEQEALQAHRARQAVERLQGERNDHRADADRRLELLLETVERAAAGLRVEWRLAGGGAEPADVVARDLPGPPATRQGSVDAPVLLAWLGQPHAHLIVDGYNVTKTGYPDLSLADQRDRLSRSLAALSSRTGAEVTVVFDGAAVVAATPSIRGVRVMFSPPGVIADDVIRDLAAAEPAGRVVVVASSDREVVDGVRASGARTVPSDVVLLVLG